jgi:hypothetical protein
VFLAVPVESTSSLSATLRLVAVDAIMAQKVRLTSLVYVEEVQD